MTTPNRAQIDREKRRLRMQAEARQRAADRENARRAARAVARGEIAADHNRQTVADHLGYSTIAEFDAARARKDR